MVGGGLATGHALGPAAARADAPSGAWTTTLGGPGDDVARRAAPAPEGWFVGGSYEQTAALGASALPAVAGRSDAWLARVDASGAPVWTRAFGSTGPDYVFDVDADAAGHVVAVGAFSQTVDFGGRSATSRGSIDTFVAAFEPSGALTWLAVAGGPAPDGANEVAVPPAGGAFVTGNTYGDFTVGTETFAWRGRAGEATQDAWVLAYAPDGGLAWARAIGGPGDDMGRAISVAPDGAVLVGGSFAETASLDTLSVTSAGARDAWLARYDGAGALQWVKRFGGVGDDYLRGVDVDGAGHIVVSGVFAGPIDIGDIALTSSAGSADIFVASLDPDGATRWAIALGGAGPDEGAELEVDAAGVITVAGELSGSFTIGDQPYASAGSRDVVVARLDADGHVLWSAIGGGPGDDVNYCLAIRGDQALLTAGTFKGTATFSGDVRTAVGGADSYLWALGAAPTPSPDAGVSPDAGSGGEPAGCACRAGPPSSAPFLVLAALVARGRRRRARRVSSHNQESP